MAIGTDSKTRPQPVLHALDVSTPYSPVPVGSMHLGKGRASYGDVTVYSSHAYAVATGVVHVVDVRDPARMRLVGTMSGDGDHWALARDRSLLDVVEGDTDDTPGALRIFDLAQPSEPREVGRLPRYSRDVFVDGARALVGGAAGADLGQTPTTRTPV